MRHTYSSSCRLAPAGPPPAAYDENTPPPVLARFFYSSHTSIDDLDSLGNPSHSLPEAKHTKGELQPFSLVDNIALENAWLSLINGCHRQAHVSAEEYPALDTGLTNAHAETLSRIVQYLATVHRDKHGVNPRALRAVNQDVTTSDAAASPSQTCCPELFEDLDNELREAFCPLLRRSRHQLSLDGVTQKVMMSMTALQDNPGSRTHQSTSAGHANRAPPNDTSAQGFELNGRDMPGAKDNYHATLSTDQSADGSRHSVNVLASARGILADDGISGTPFMRVGSSASLSSGTSPPTLSRKEHPACGRNETETSSARRSQPGLGRAVSTAPTETLRRLHSTTEVVVGSSRLHTVSLPALQMRPIYWSPINDRAVVIRATWFYR